MAIDVQVTDKMIGVIDAFADGVAARERLREGWPELQFSLCSEDDVPDELAPVGETTAFRLYLLDGNGHCLHLTSDRDAATGLVLAEKME